MSDAPTAAARARRRAALPPLRYPADLPVVAAREELLAALHEHQVVVVAGETGSGKTTQLPKLCLELGRGIAGRIGHTQPRRLAARAVAERLSEELGSPLGEAVGYQVRFHDQVGPDSLVKLMTDGILLAEIAGDPTFSQYDTLIIDEAHERSLNVDFLLGYLHRLLPRRPDLSVVITSATIDPGRFARHFGGAPVVEVSGRSYPVEVRYRPPEPDVDPVQAIAAAVDELAAEPPGDVLVFLSGEREIRDTAEVLRGRVPAGTEVLPLFGRLSMAEQHRVFTAHSGRRVVLATNVAETSLTVPGIRYVVDPGTARISRYSTRTKVQRLPIEPISQASARQRAGRCGRVAPGVCLRLYAEEDFASRPAYTEPEILRTNLASVLLQMTAIGLGDVADFPFLDPPDRRQVRDAVALLHELGAVAEVSGGEQRLTRVGRQLAALPLDPRLGRMVVAADEHGCLREVLVIAAALAIQDPRERPAQAREAAEELHRRFVHPDSDFLTLLHLWRYLQERQRELSGSAFRRMCRAEHLNWLRVREWQDLHAQLRRAARRLGLGLQSAPAPEDQVHLSLLAGLLSHIGLRDAQTRQYLGARGTRFAIAPGSALSRHQPQWVVAAELVETNRLWARTCARIAPSWVERLAGHLVLRSYSEPRWDAGRAAVVAQEKVTLYGVPLFAGRTVPYARVDPVVARQLFLRHALVEGDWDAPHAFLASNRALMADVDDLEHRARRRGIAVDDEALYAFYDARVPAEVVSGRHFDSWWKRTRQAEPDRLTFSLGLLVRDAGIDPGDYPDAWQQGDLRLALSYRFEPGAAEDGVTVHVPVGVLSALDPQPFQWQVPGLREELVAALIRSLPKPLRVRLVPAPDTARAVLQRLEPRSEPLLAALERELRQLTGVVVAREDWHLERVPAHLRPTFRVVGERGQVLAEGKDLRALREELAPQVRQALSVAAGGLERGGLTGWVDLPTTVPAGPGVTGYPALVDEGDTVAVRVLGSAAEQRRAMRAGVRRLLLLSVPSPLKAVVSDLAPQAKLVLSTNPYAGVPALLGDCVLAAADDLLREAGEPVADREGFERVREQVRARLVERTAAVVGVVVEVLRRWQALSGRLGGPSAAQVDLREQLDRLVRPGFVSAAGLGRLPDLVRYLDAMQVRLDRLPRSADRDRAATQAVHAVQEEVDALLARRPDDPEVAELLWLVEELRVSLFAPGTRTRQRVSEQRIYQAIDRLAG